MELPRLIVTVLDWAGKRLDPEDIEDLEPEVLVYVGAIKARYSELKSVHDFSTAAFLAREEIVARMLAEHVSVMQELILNTLRASSTGRAPDSESGG